MKKDKASSVFLDTTFILPFFQVEINVDKFDVGRFRDFISAMKEVHVSELSIYEAKAKLSRLYSRDSSYSEALKNFGSNLEVLKKDKRFIFHTYSSEIDKYSNLLIDACPELDIFDALIVAHAVDTGFLLTEDEELVRLHRTPEFARNPLFTKIEIKRWRDLSERLRRGG